MAATTHESVRLEELIQRYEDWVEIVSERNCYVCGKSMQEAIILEDADTGNQKIVPLCRSCQRNWHAGRDEEQRQWLAS